jgi:hypothetical protein
MYKVIVNNLARIKIGIAGDLINNVKNSNSKLIIDLSAAFMYSKTQ